MGRSKVTYIPPKLKFYMKREPIDNVAIYARVSTRSAAQMHSLAAQVSELTRLVASRVSWRLVDIYMDVGSASGYASREEYNRMIEDAQAGKFSVVLTKSVQRFGRNTEETLSTIEMFIELGVVVYFQIEGYASNNSEARLFTSLRTEMAAEDNKSRRADRMWGVRRRVEDGTSEMYRRPCFGYRKNDDGALIVDKEQAEIVREIFKSYLAGTSILGIKRDLESRHIPSPRGKEEWSLRTIDLILSNEKYTGNIVLFKTVMVNYPYSVRKNNSGRDYREQFCMANGVDPIIDEETFCAVQEEKKRRSLYEEGSDGRRRKAEKYSSKREEEQGSSRQPCK